MDSIRRGNLPKQLSIFAGGGGGGDSKGATDNNINEITSFRKLVKESQIKIKEALRDFSNL